MRNIHNKYINQTINRLVELLSLECNTNQQVKTSRLGY